MRSRAPTGKIKSENQHQAFLTEPEGDSLTPSQARGLLTRAPFDGGIISLKAKSSDTIDNVRAKIQDKED
jgi:hypothetical protein